MYHIEFYNKILPRVSGGNPLLSGIIGDAWAGSVNIDLLTRDADVRRLGFTHGPQADPSKSAFASDRQLLLNYWEMQKTKLEDARFRVIEAMRFKIILLCYLVNVPRHLGFNCWSPFLDIDVALAMLNLPPDRRRDRIWQKDFFRKLGLDFESLYPHVSHNGTLDAQAQQKLPVKPLDPDSLKEVVDPKYVERINEAVHYSEHFADKVIDKLLDVRKVGGALRKLGLINRTQKQVRNYQAYLVLLPLEKALRRRK